MAFFSDETRRIQNIRTEKLSKVYSVKGKKVQIDYLDAYYGDLDGKKILLDEDIISSTFKDILKVYYYNDTKFHPIPSHIVISNSDLRKSESPYSSEQPGYDLTILTSEPRYSFDEVYLPQQARKQIQTALTLEKHKDKLLNDWGLESVLKDGRALILNFFGPPGTGKSMTAEAIADTLGKKIIQVNYAQLESKFVGETPKNIKKCFAEAEEKNAVLIFDEADSFLGKRVTNVSQAADHGVNIARSVMLMELERFTGIVIFTTNLITNYDSAFERRIFASLEFSLPDQAGREQIWKRNLPETLPLDSSVSAEILAEKFDHISGADIKDIVLYASIYCLEGEQEKLTFEDFDAAYTFIMGRYQDRDPFTGQTGMITEEQY